MFIKIKGWDEESIDWTVEKIRYSYDRHERMWCIYLLTEEEYQVDDIIRCTKYELDSMLEELNDEYNTTDCQKW